MRRRDAQIAGQRLLQAARQTVAVDGGDDRLPYLEPARDAAQAVIVVAAPAALPRSSS
jgi:hypothetical protein